MVFFVFHAVSAPPRLHTQLSFLQFPLGVIIVPFEGMTLSLKEVPGSPLKEPGEELEALGEQVGTRARGQTGPSVGHQPITQSGRS